MYQVFIGIILLILQIIIYKSEYIYKINDTIFILIEKTIIFLCLVFISMMIFSIYINFKNKNSNIIIVSMQCIGAIISIIQYRYWIRHFDGNTTPERFILIPYILSVILSIFIYLIVFKKRNLETDK